MLKKNIKYTDYNGVERNEEFLFNLSKAELMEMEMSTQGGLAEMIQKVVDTQDAPAIIKVFKDIQVNIDYKKYTLYVQDYLTKCKFISY